MREGDGSLRAEAPPAFDRALRAAPKLSRVGIKTGRKISVSMGKDVFQVQRIREFRDLKNAIVKASDPGEELNFFINYIGPVSDFDKLPVEAQKSRIRNLEEGLRLLEDRNRARQHFNEVQAASRNIIKIDPVTMTATVPKRLKDPQQLFDLCVHGKVFTQKMMVIDAENLCFLELTKTGKIPGDFKNRHPGIVPTFKPIVEYTMPVIELVATDDDNQLLFRRCVDNKVKQGMTEEEATASCLSELGKALPKGFQPRPRGADGR